MIRVSVNGVAGRMGQAVVRLAAADSDMKLVEALERKGAAVPSLPAGVTMTHDHQGADVMIDFSAPAGMRERLAQCAAKKTAFVSGTTGLEAADTAALLDAAQKIPVLHAPNFALGVVVLVRLVTEAAKALGDYDVEILDVHHNKKKDAPSGTTERLLNIVCEALDSKPGDVARFGRKGMAPRTAKEIGVHVIRAGDIVGEHTVIFAGPGERIELSERASSRDAFASGAIRAAKYLAGKKPGLYTIEQVLFGERG